jgi:tetratricopeptide (TPR) repeat protein
MYADCVRDTAPRVRIYCLSGLATTANELGEHEEAEGYIDQAYEAEASIVPTDTVMIARLRAIRGQIALALGRLDEARNDLDAAIANTNNMVILIPALAPRAELNLQEGKYSAAEDDARELLALCRKSQGGIRYSNRTGLAWLLLGRILTKQGKPVDARAALLAAVENLSNTVDPDHPMLRLAQRLAGT